ncbi:flavin reductase family protein [Litchfieldella rifensis]|uniref:Flavin reductase family protein n=1 Tax=Litchfieldella rifensis TaxID=762643 RepID=A0ABV7LJP0_9GAMM
MSEHVDKASVPLERVRRYLEPGPIVLVSSAWEGQRNIMTMGWYTVMAFSPSLVGCIISAGNHSFEMIRRGGECVINLPTTALTDQVVGIGNNSGAEVDKFERFGLSAQPAERVGAPLIGECHAHFECRLFDDSLVERYNFFIWEVVSARAAVSPEYPETLHYTGDGVFMVAGEIIERRDQIQPLPLGVVAQHQLSG